MPRGARRFWFTDAQFITGKEAYPQCIEILERILAEKLEIEWQLSSVADFSTASLVFCASVLKVGDSSVNGSGIDTVAGRYTLRVSNEFNGTVYRYARLYERYTGTIDTGYSFRAFLAVR